MTALVIFMFILFIHPQSHILNYFPILFPLPPHYPDVSSNLFAALVSCYSSLSSLLYFLTSVIS